MLILPVSRQQSQNQASRKVQGFTLVELLVVIAIIGVLVALLLPAVQAARESARRTTCVNQLRQVGLAIQNHINSRGVFPTGGAGFNPAIEDYVSGGRNNPGTPNGPDKQGLGWAYQILPYLEQNAVHGLVSTDQIKQTVVPFYTCPSRRSPQVMETEDSIGAGIVAVMDYASAQPLTTVCGGDGEKHDITLTHPFQGRVSNKVAEDAFWCTAPARVPNTNDSVFDGVIVRILWKKIVAATATAPARGKFLSGGTRSVKPAQVTDGMSNTLMISEKFVRSDMAESNVGPTGEFSYSDDSGWTDGWDPDTVRFTGYQPISDNTKGFCYQPSTAKYCTGELADVYFFGSSHPGGINSVFADGSVHAIAFDVDILLFNGLGTRNGEEILDFTQLQ